MQGVICKSPIFFLFVLDNLFGKCSDNYTFSICVTGGTLGLFTGMSILSMVEIMFWLAKMLLAFLQSISKQSKTVAPKGAPKAY